MQETIPRLRFTALLFALSLASACGKDEPPPSVGASGTGGQAGRGGSNNPAGSGGSPTETGGASGDAAAGARDGAAGTGASAPDGAVGGESGNVGSGAGSEGGIEAGTRDGASADRDTGGPTLGGLPGRTSILGSMHLINDYFAAKWPDPTIDIVTDRARPSNLWTRAVYYEGLMAFYDIEPDAARKSSYYGYAVRWASSPSHPWLVAYADNTATNADFQACGQTYIELYQIDPQPVRIADIRTNIDRMVTGPITNVWIWIDAIQMSMPVFAKLGALFDDPRYFDTMWALYSDARDLQGGGFFNQQAGLFWRDANFNPGGTYTRSPGGQDIYWSRGNGWVFAALLRVLSVIPSNETHRAQYVSDFRAMAAALLPLQRSDGFWNESLINPTHCESVGKPGQDGPETSGTALFTYGLAWGIRTGLLDAAIYGPAVVRAWNGLVQLAVHPNGLLGWVQSTGAAPCDASDTTGLGYDITPNFEDYGVGSFLLGGSEVYRLAP
jgi:rhamnogalacturonyl hydrolase YesR